MTSPVLREGRVVWPDGSPAVGAIVAIASGTAPTPEIAIRCDQEGRFRIALPEGWFRIEARAPDGATGGIEVAGSEGGEIMIVVAPT